MNNDILKDILGDEFEFSEHSGQDHESDLDLDIVRLLGKTNSPPKTPANQTHEQNIKVNNSNVNSNLTSSNVRTTADQGQRQQTVTSQMPVASAISFSSSSSLHTSSSQPKSTMNVRKSQPRASVVSSTSSLALSQSNPLTTTHKQNQFMFSLNGVNQFTSHNNPTNNASFDLNLLSDSDDSSVSSKSVKQLTSSVSANPIVDDPQVVRATMSEVSVTDYIAAHPEESVVLNERKGVSRGVDLYQSAMTKNRAGATVSYAETYVSNNGDMNRVRHFGSKNSNVDNDIPEKPEKPERVISARPTSMVNRPNRANNHTYSQSGMPNNHFNQSANNKSTMNTSTHQSGPAVVVESELLSLRSTMEKHIQSASEARAEANKLRQQLELVARENQQIKQKMIAQKAQSPPLTTRPASVNRTLLTARPVSVNTTVPAQSTLNASTTGGPLTAKIAAKPSLHVSNLHESLSSQNSMVNKNNVELVSCGVQTSALYSKAEESAAPEVMARKLTHATELAQSFHKRLDDKEQQLIRLQTQGAALADLLEDLHYSESTTSLPDEILEQLNNFRSLLV